jgi:hypothetical protein
LAAPITTSNGGQLLVQLPSQVHGSRPLIVDVPLSREQGWEQRVDSHVGVVTHEEHSGGG